MKTAFLIPVILLTMFCSCRKGTCKEQQSLDLAKELERFQKEVANTNLTVEQINELNKRHNEINKQILAECN